MVKGVSNSQAVAHALGSMLQAMAYTVDEGACKVDQLLGDLQVVHATDGRVSKLTAVTTDAARLLAVWGTTIETTVLLPPKVCAQVRAARKVMAAIKERMLCDVY